jgi:LysM repeat protein
VYRLSLRYGVSTEAIFKLNPGSRTLIKAGEKLLIPKKEKSTFITNSNNPEFKNHLVSKGETKYGLSKQYNISISELEKLNPEITKMLLAGSTIQIPKNNLENENTLYRQTPNTKIHVVNKGDTKYGLSKRFNIPIKKLEQLNPQIVPMLKSGMTIIVHEKTTSELVNYNNKENSTVKQKIEKEFTTTKTNSLDTITKKPYRDYIIKPKETLYSLAKKANMPINEFLELNPDLKKSVLKGNIIKMPFDIINKENVIAAQNSNNQSQIKKKNTFIVSVIWDDSKTILNTVELDKKSNYLIGLQKAIDTISVLYPFNKIEFNNKSTKALSPGDSSKAYNYNINLYPIDSLGEKFNNYKSADMLSLNYKHDDSIKKILIRSLPNKLDMRNEVLSYLKKQNGHVICIYDEDHQINKLDIQNILPNVKFISTKKNGSFNTNDLKKSLQSDLKNFVIIESNIVGVYLNTTNILLKEISNTNIQLVVLNPENIPSESFISSKRFNILELLYPKQFNTELNNGLNDDVALGFAVNYDILQRIFKNGLQEFGTPITTVFGYSFDYELNEGVFNNKSVKLFVFDKNSEGIEINKY